MQIYWNKKSVYTGKELNPHRIGLIHQRDRRYFVLEHQYGYHDVMRKRSITIFY